MARTSRRLKFLYIFSAMITCSVAWVNAGNVAIKSVQSAMSSPRDIKAPAQVQENKVAEKPSLLRKCVIPVLSIALVGVTVRCRQLATTNAVLSKNNADLDRTLQHKIQQSDEFFENACKAQAALRVLQRKYDELEDSNRTINHGINLLKPLVAAAAKTGAPLAIAAVRTYLGI